MKDTFWLVWNLSRRAPTVTHESLASARREADRLAESTPGERFYVVKALGFSERMKPVAWTDLNDRDSEIPF